MSNVKDKPSDLIPFLFARLTDESRVAIEKGGRAVIKDWVVMIAIHDLVTYNSTWMSDKNLGKICLVPDVDLCFETHVFPSFQEARSFIALWWMKQITAEQMGLAFNKVGTPSVKG